MKNSLVVTIISAALGVGCQSKPKPQTLHVTEVSECSDVEVVGTFNGKSYALQSNRERNHTPLYVACIPFIRSVDAGKDFPASVDDATGIMTVQVDQKPVYYTIESVRAK